jgi:hypothetical protein
LKLPSWFWRIRFFKIFSIFSHSFAIISHWWRVPISFERTWILYPLGRFVPNLVKIDLVVQEKKSKIWKVNRRNDWHTTDTQKSSLELSAQVSKN